MASNRPIPDSSTADGANAADVRDEAGVHVVDDAREVCFLAVYALEVCYPEG